MEGTIKTAIIAAAIITVGAVYNLRPTPPVDPLTQALKLCGDTPAPVEYRTEGYGRAARSYPVEPEQTPYAMAVKSVDDCRTKVLEHFKGRDP